MTTAENINGEASLDVKIKMAPNHVANFWAKVDKSPHPLGCWEWRAAMHYKGYGLYRFDLKTHKAHRLSYRMAFGEIDQAIKVCHACDNRKCVNPAHLWLGTDKDNSDDKHAKGRANPPRGENNGGGGKLTWEKVREIRRIRSEEGLSQQAIADMFNITQTMVSNIVGNRNWVESGHQNPIGVPTQF